MKTNQKQGMITLFYKFLLFFREKQRFPPFVALLPLCLEHCFGEFFTSLVRKFDAFLASRMFITIVTRARQWYLWPAEPAESSTRYFFLRVL